MQKLKLRQYGIFALICCLVFGLVFGLLAVTDKLTASAAEVPQIETVTPLSSTLGIDDNMTVTDDMTIEAKYEDATYTLTFKMKNFDGSDNIVTCIATHGHQYFEYFPNGVTAPEGYNFTGWGVSINELVTGEKTLVAQYSLKEVSLVYEMLNADGSKNNVILHVNYGEPLSDHLPETITAPMGKHFAGWNKDITGTVPAEQIIITAQYEWNTYTITLKSLNAEGQEQTSTVTATHGHQLSEYLPTSDITAPVGKHFTGWHVDVAMVVTDAMEIDASYAWNTYTITLATLNADGSANNTTVTAIHGHKLSEYIPASGVTAPAHKHLTGWDKAGTTEVMGAMTVTAVYAWDQFTVTFRYLNAEGEITEETKTVDYGTKIVDILPEVPEVPGKVFTGWGVSENAIVTQNLRVIMETGVTDIDGNPVNPPEVEDNKTLFEKIKALGSPYYQLVYAGSALAGVLIIAGIISLISNIVGGKKRKQYKR